MPILPLPMPIPMPLPMTMFYEDANLENANSDDETSTGCTEVGIAKVFARHAPNSFWIDGQRVWQKR